jgi:hypothetical protein
MLKWLKKIFVPAETPIEEVLVLKKQVIGKKSELTKMTKVQLEELGREYNIELDRRLTKTKLVDQIWKVVKPKKSK